MKKILAALMVLVSAFSLFACINDSRTAIVFWHTMGKTTDPALGGQALLEVFIKEFEEANPEYFENYRIVHEQKGGYTDLNSSVGKAIPAGNEPHLAYCYPDHVAGYLRTGRVQELNSLINDPEIGLSADEIADYVPAFWAEGSVYGNETIYNIAFSKSTEVMFYNKTYFSANNLTMPENPTWADIEDLATKIKALDATKTPFGYDSGDNLFITASYQLGIPYTSVTNTTGTPVGSIDFKNDDAEKMVNYFNETFVKKGLMTTKDLLNGKYTSDKFRAGELYMSVSSTGGTKYNVPTSDDPAIFEVGVVPAPRFSNELAVEILGEGSTVREAFIQQGPSIVMFKKDSMETKIAWEFLKYITAPNQSARFSVPSGYSPVRTSSYEEQVMKDLFADTTSASAKLTAAVLNLTNELRANFFTSPAFAKSAQTRQAVGALFQDVFAGNRTIKDAFTFHYNSVAV